MTDAVDTSTGARAAVAAPRAHDEVLERLNTLTRDTYQLWDHEWVGFSWRNYTYDHVRRVRNLALSLAAEEGADPRVLVRWRDPDERWATRGRRAGLLAQ